MYDFIDRIKTTFLDLIKSRLFIVVLLFSLLFGSLIYRVFYLQIVQGQEFLDNYTLQIQKTKEVQGTRGRIFDRNGVILAENTLSWSVAIEDSGDYEDRNEKNEMLNETILNLINIIESHGDSVLATFGVVLDDNDNYAYSTREGTPHQRFLADVFGYATIDKLSEKENETTAEEMINYLCTDERYGYGIDQNELDKHTVLKLINIRYAIGLNSFRKYIATTIATNVCDETRVQIMENLDVLVGVSVEEDSLRSYPAGEYFSALLGYTGQISREEYDALDPEIQDSYALTDIIGKSGIEQSMDATLQGEKEVVKLYVDSVGKVIESTKDTDSKAGDDLFLTIDAELTEAIYKILEEKLAGILLLKMQDTLTFDATSVDDTKKIMIPVGDVYHALIDNDVINTKDFANEDAKTNEKKVQATFDVEIARVLAEIEKELTTPSAKAYKDLPLEMQGYMSFIASDLLTQKTKVIDVEKVDATHASYIAWKTDEEISLYTFLNEAISNNWIDTSKLQNHIPDQSKYSVSDETYQGMVAFIMDSISTDNNFKNLVYRYLIQKGVVSGQSICLILYEQGVLPMEKPNFDALTSGTLSPYIFIRDKIQRLEITPGQLALEPCSASFVLTDIYTGEVIALVSYPAFDNNRLSNSIDNTYFSQLSNSSASPMYNRATQERTAPGSTLKPISAIAGLTENVITPSSTISCSGTFHKVAPNPRCWSFPLAHGYLDVEGALEHSCNCYFYELGYRLGLNENALKNVTDSDPNGDLTKADYSSSRGIRILDEYMALFGLAAPSGVEIIETMPHISDEDSVRSAIGQGTNNFTTAQLARYITAVANKGTLFNLSLLDKIQNVNGEIIEDFSPSISSEIEGISSSTWNSVHKGMRAVIASTNGTYYPLESAGFQLSGKTGTAQQSKTHPDHALFVGFAPSDNPKIAFSCRIANGYASAYASEIGRDVMMYYYKLPGYEDVITGVAAQMQEVASSD